ncbi:hypothetical protein [Brucella sp. NBRC 14130]|uniref:hypothetical protein n=1 Tax=Brucella sp. NBRC 14130 TaxID=3075483 RepID=UPI00333E7BD4
MATKPSITRRSCIKGASMATLAASLAVVTKTSMAVAAEPAAASDEEFRQLFKRLSPDEQRDFLEFMRSLSDPETHGIWNGPAFYEVFENNKLICCWIDRVWCEKERDLVYECRIYWDGYLLAPAERFSKGNLLIVRKLTDLKLRSPKYQRSA